MAANEGEIRKSRAQSLSKGDRGRSSSGDKVDTPGGPSSRNSPTKSDAWLCNTCEKLFTDKDDKLLTCEYCSRHRCIACLGFTKAVYKAISGKVYLPYICDGPDGCIQKSLTAIKDTKTIEDRCNDIMSGFAKQVDERMNTIEDDMKSVKEGMHELKTDIVREIKESFAGAGAYQQVNDQTINSGGREPPSTTVNEQKLSRDHKSQRQ
ncbi:hypothetical protein DPMN_050032 [Dreissena polymorpha]|uniref:FYVE-type domain-containing protein n=1 Tax=Dreissena polymorpha TaxID=45954 RepID=A0A9D4CFD1_DREPO|nr:hypothetical protein DPMN_050032 [Dreissena polymorpha]